MKKIIEIIFLLLALLFSSACASSPAKPGASVPSAQDSNPPVNLPSQIETAPEFDLSTDAGLDAAFAAAAVPTRTVEEEERSQIPEECQAFEYGSAKQRSCWHTFLYATSFKLPGGECDYTFQCGEPGTSMTCQLGINRDKLWQGYCTMKLPGEE